VASIERRRLESILSKDGGVRGNVWVIGLAEASELVEELEELVRSPIAKRNVDEVFRWEPLKSSGDLHEEGRRGWLVFRQHVTSSETHHHLLFLFHNFYTSKYTTRAFRKRWSLFISLRRILTRRQRERRQDAPPFDHTHDRLSIAIAIHQIIPQRWTHTCPSRSEGVCTRGRHSGKGISILKAYSLACVIVWCGALWKRTGW
jgi:hypothetical protein